MIPCTIKNNIINNIIIFYLFIFIKFDKYIKKNYYIILSTITNNVIISRNRL